MLSCNQRPWPYLCRLLGRTLLTYVGSSGVQAACRVRPRPWWQDADTVVPPREPHPSSLQLDQILHPLHGATLLGEGADPFIPREAGILSFRGRKGSRPSAGSVRKKQCLDRIGGVVLCYTTCVCFFATNTVLYIRSVVNYRLLRCNVSLICGPCRASQFL